MVFYGFYILLVLYLIWVVYYVIVVTLCDCNIVLCAQLTTTNLLRDDNHHSKLLLASTLDGTLHALSPSSGSTKWSISDGRFSSVNCVGPEVLVM